MNREEINILQDIVDVYEKEDIYPLLNDKQARTIKKAIEALKAQEWIPCGEIPKHHNDVLVTGIESIGNARVYKVMQWDGDRWRPENYAPSIIWDAWKEIEPYTEEMEDKE